ncbi:MAG: type I methionyl aminopeptidase [bacterium]|nr:type I methionyl aminopeptidase [bacterium]
MILKTPQEIAIMRENGQKLDLIKKELKKLIVPGAVPLEIDKVAEKLILEAGGTPSFKMVRDYRWTTCINIKDGVVHGIPDKRPFLEGDIVSLDIGMFYKGFHSDSAFTVPVGKIPVETQKFLEAGRRTLKECIKQAKIGKNITDISRTMQKELEKDGYSPVRDLTGHGVGRELHEKPFIPCYWDPIRHPSIKIEEGAVLAIEVIYCLGSYELQLSREDNWTISTKDGKIAALFEETVAVTKSGPEVLTS